MQRTEAFITKTCIHGVNGNIENHPAASTERAFFYMLVLNEYIKECTAVRDTWQCCQTTNQPWQGRGS